MADRLGDLPGAMGEEADLAVESPGLLAAAGVFEEALQ
jgi:hypothetical protein